MVSVAVHMDFNFDLNLTNITGQTQKFSKRFNPKRYEN
jgi:hypothetical protein